MAVIGTYSAPVGKEHVITEFETLCKKTLKSKSRVIISLLEDYIKKENQRLESKRSQTSETSI